jgi:hypothetical protein
MYDCISNPKSEIGKWTANKEVRGIVQFEISDFGFEMQDLSTFEIPPDPCHV